MPRYSLVTVIREQARLDLRQVDRCLSETEETLAERVQKFRTYVDAQTQGIPTNAREELYDWHSDTHWELAEVFPRILRHSLFITSYGFLEHYLFQLCGVLERMQPRGLEVTDLRGNDDFDQARRYITKVHGVEFPENSSEWQRLQSHKKIRNCLVHRDGQVSPTKDKDVRTFIEKNPLLGSIDQSRLRLSLQPQACEDLLRTSGVFLDDLFERARARTTTRV